MKGLVEAFGRQIVEASESMGRFVFLIRSTAGWMLRSRIEWRQVLIQMARIGVDSLPVTAMTMFFTGMVLALQSGATTKHFFNVPLFIGTVVSFSIVMELGPVLTAVVVSGRAGAADVRPGGVRRVQAVRAGQAIRARRRGQRARRGEAGESGRRGHRTRFQST